MNKKTLGLLVLVLLLVGGVVAWWASADRELPEFTHVQQLQEKLMHDETMTGADRDEGWREVKQKWSTFSQREQQALEAQRLKKDQSQMDAYFELETEEERLAHIDEVIDQWDKKAEQKKSSTNKSGGNKKTNSDADKNREQRKKKEYAKEKRSDPEAMREMLRGHLDNHSPDERVRSRIYWTAVKSRWAERHGEK